MRPRALFGAALVLAAFGAFFAALFAPVWLAHRFVGDPVDQLIETLPAYLGAHPLWEPRTMLGYPLGADPNQAYFYPLGLLRRIPGSFDWYEIAAYVLAACGTFGLVRATTRSTAGAVAGALVFALGGFMIAQAGHVSIVEPAAWVPVLFWSLTELGVRARAAVASLGCVAALACAILAGQPQTTVDALFFALPYAAIVARRADDGARAYLGRAALALALGAGCAGIALVPETQLFLASARATFGFERFQEFTVPVLQQPLRLFFPYALGASSLWPYEHSRIDIGSFAEMSDYAGIAGVAFAIVALRRARTAPYARYWTWAAAVALVLATGNQLGIAWLTYRIPLYGLFRAPGRIGAETDLAIAVLAGIGIAAIEAGRVPARDAARACGIAAIAMAATYALFVAIAALPPNVQILVVSGWATFDANPLENAALAIPMLVLVCVTASAVWWARRPASRARAALALAVVAADMLSFAAFAYWRSAAFGADRLVAPAYTSALRAKLAPLGQRLVSVPLPGVDDGGIGPNLNLLWDVPSLRGYTPLPLARTQALFDSDWAVPVWPHASVADATLDLTAVRYVVVVESPDVPADHASIDPTALFLREGPRWRFVARVGNDSILENLRALPRVWVARTALPSAGTDVIAAIRAGGFDPRAIAYVDGLGERRLPARGSAELVSRGDLDMRVRARCTAACFLVTSDTAYPGWSATIDGRDVPLYVADAALRGVFVPAGSHAIAFRYEPRAFEVGAFLSAGSALLTLLVAASLGRSKQA